MTAAAIHWSDLLCGVLYFTLWRHYKKKGGKERELESLVSAELGQRLTWNQTHTHPQCMKLLTNLRLMHSYVTWLFGVMQININNPTVNTQLNSHHCWWKPTWHDKCSCTVLVSFLLHSVWLLSLSGSLLEVTETGCQIERIVALNKTNFLCTLIESFGITEGLNMTKV